VLSSIDGILCLTGTSSSLPAMKMGVPFLKILVSETCILIWSAASMHHHDSAEKLKIPSNHLLRRDMQTGPERGSTFKASLEPRGESPMDMQESNANLGKHGVRERVKFNFAEQFRDAVQLDQKHKSLHKLKDLNLCNDAFQKGSANSNDCAETWHVLITDWPTCDAAAKLSCPDTNNTPPVYDCLGFPFEISGDWQRKYPKGCFINANDAKWYYNPVGDIPSGTITGTPVCVEKQYVSGTAGSRSTCPSGYSTINDEMECRSAAVCRSFCTYQEFRVLNTTTEDQRPKGCHQLSDGCLQFNNKSEDPECDVGGTSCTGVPLCKVAHELSGG